MKHGFSIRLMKHNRLFFHGYFSDPVSVFLQFLFVFQKRMIQRYILNVPYIFKCQSKRRHSAAMHIFPQRVVFVHDLGSLSDSRFSVFPGERAIPAGIALSFLRMFVFFCRHCFFRHSGEKSRVSSGILQYSLAPAGIWSSTIRR